MPSLEAAPAARRRGDHGRRSRAPTGGHGLHLSLPLVLVAALLAGIGLDVAIVTWNTAFQQHVPQAEQGRMSAFNGVGERLAIPLGYLIAALAAHSWNSQAVLLACAAMITVATVLNLCVPAVHRVNRLTPSHHSRASHDDRQAEQT